MSPTRLLSVSGRVGIRPDAYTYTRLLDLFYNAMYSVLNLVQKLKLKIEASGFEIGDISSMEVIRPPSVVNNISSMTQVDTPNGIIPHPFVTNVATIACGAYVNVSMQKTRDKGNDAGEPSNRLIRNIKRKRDSLTMEAVEKQVGQPMDEASKSLGVSRSTLKRFLRDHSIPKWPKSKLGLPGRVCSQKLPEWSLDLKGFPTSQRIKDSTAYYNILGYLSLPVVDPARGCCVGVLELVTLSKHDYAFDDLVSEALKMFQQAMAHQDVVFENTKNTEQATKNVDLNYVDAFRRLSGADFIDGQGSFLKMAGCSSGSVLDYHMEPIENPMEAIKSLNVSQSTLKRSLQVHSIPRCPMPKLSNRSACVTDSKQHLFHSSGDLSFSTTVKARGRFLSKPTLHVYRVANLIVRLRRWKKRSFVRIAMAHQDDSLLIENTTNTEHATDNVDPLVPTTAMPHQNDPVVFVAKLIVRLRRWKKRSFVRIAMAHQEDYLVSENTTNTEQATNNVDTLMARTAMAHQNDPVVVDSTTYMEQATYNVDPLLDLDLTDYSVYKFQMLSSGSVHDYLMVPDGIENPMADIGMGLEGAWPSDPLQQATDYVDPPMDVDVTDYSVDEFQMLSSGSLHDYLMVPDGIENPMADIGMGLEPGGCLAL